MAKIIKFDTEARNLLKDAVLPRSPRMVLL